MALHVVLFSVSIWVCSCMCKRRNQENIQMSPFPCITCLIGCFLFLFFKWSIMNWKKGVQRSGYRILKLEKCLYFLLGHPTTVRIRMREQKNEGRSRLSSSIKWPKGPEKLEWFLTNCSSIFNTQKENK